MKYKIININDISDDEYRKWFSFMDVEKQDRVKRFHFVDDKKRTIAGGMLARTMIANYCNVNYEDIVFGKNKYGKPFAKDLPIEFNISHSNDLVICTINDTPIGVDIEKVRSVDLFVIKKVCNKNELEYVLSDNTYKRFFEIWTFKEAYFKCIGTGITDFKSIDYFNNNHHKLKIVCDEYITHIIYWNDLESINGSRSFL